MVRDLIGSAYAAADEALLLALVVMQAAVTLMKAVQVAVREQLNEEAVVEVLPLLVLVELLRVMVALEN